MPHINAEIVSGIRKRGFHTNRFYDELVLASKRTVKYEDQRVLQKIQYYPSGSI